MLQLPPSLKAMGQYAQFIPYKLIWDPKRSKMNKIPLDYRTGLAGDVQNDPGCWLPFETVASFTDKIGFVFTKNDPFFFLDIDGCNEGGQWSALATGLLQQFAGAAVEVSQSGNGLHIFGVGECPPHACKNMDLNLELYTEARFCALTGIGSGGDSATNHSAALSTTVAGYFPVRAVDTGADWTDGPCLEWNGPADDDALILKALAAKSAATQLGGRAGFKELFEGDVDALAATYPDHYADRQYDESRADGALAQHLAFWTGRDCERIKRIMERSALVRDKWQRADYMHRTILRAIGGQGTVYGTPKPSTAPSPEQVAAVVSGEPAPAAVGPAEPVPAATAVEGLRVGSRFMAVTQQVEHFKGCVYVLKPHRVLIPSGDLIKSEQFRVLYGGYDFSMDNENFKTSKNAWEVFSESQAYSFAKVYRAAFLPKEKPGSIIKLEGDDVVNTYFPCPVDRTPGDASRLYDLLARMLPNERDRTIIMSYMAACVQYPGYKFQWAPLIQGVEGNGKSFLSRAVAAAVGKKYTFLPKFKDLENNFNAWMSNRIFIGVEDIYVPDHNKELMEILKPMITSEDQGIELKGVDQAMAEVCCNFMFNSNYRDAMRKTSSDRRFAFFFTAQQKVSDLKRDGLTPEYMRDLYEWFKNGNGAAIITDALYTYKIPDEFNPANGGRAPETSTTAEAITLSLGSIEQEVVESIERGAVGFCGGWVSSIHLELLLKESRIKMSHMRRKTMMEELGYVLHPNLPKGRACNPVDLDMGSKPRLFIKAEHIAAQLKRPVEIVDAYVAAQKPQETARVAAAFNQGVPAV